LDNRDISFWCRNCFDERSATVIFDAVNQPGSYETFVGDPRQWGVTGSVRL